MIMYTNYTIKEWGIYSNFLNRKVKLSIISPSEAFKDSYLPLLIVNDGQDFGQLGLLGIVSEMVMQGIIPPILIVGVHANENRVLEYGVSGYPDYANRGTRASDTTDFVLQELFPHIAQNFKVDKNHIAYAGCSLGGLMALDIAWNHAQVFKKVGVFSGALWWREKALDLGYSKSDRIMHKKILHAESVPELSFWFQTGTKDELEDRDNDGVIDSIQDTLECIAELERKGFRWNESIRYVEVEDGEHNPSTWALVFPDFLKWAFGIMSS